MGTLVVDGHQSAIEVPDRDPAPVDVETPRPSDREFFDRTYAVATGHRFSIAQGASVTTSGHLIPRSSPDADEPLARHSGSSDLRGE